MSGGKDVAMLGDPISDRVAFHITNNCKKTCVDLVVLVGLLFFLFWLQANDLTIRGEESRRGRIAWEMIHSGDWLVPRLQGEPWLSRPALQYWAIAAVGSIRGVVDLWSIRLPSLLAISLTTLCIYGVARLQMSRFGSMSAACVFMTMGQVLQLGRLGETEAVFTLFVSGSLLVWYATQHWGRGCWVGWVLGYFLCALGTLTKGPQAPVYFCGTLLLYLAWKRDWKRLLSLPHAAGIAIYLATVLSWQIPFARQAGQHEINNAYMSEVFKRFNSVSPLEIMQHLIEFPGEVFLVCLLPWSFLLLAYRYSGFRQKLGNVSDWVVFLGISLAVAFPTVWLPPSSNTRYLMPMYPCFAMLIAIAIDKLTSTDYKSLSLRNLWSRYSRMVGIGICGSAVVIPVIMSAWVVPKLRMDLVPLIAFVVMAGTVGALILRVSHSAEQARRRRWVLMFSIVLYSGATYNLVVINHLQRRANDPRESIAQLRRTLPKSDMLISYGLIHHRFTLQFGEDLPMRQWPTSNEQVVDDPLFFCFSHADADCPIAQLPFAWDPVAVINCDRNSRNVPHDLVIVGKRLPDRDGVSSNEQPAVARRPDQLLQGVIR
jgi:4-amino-4-deoxy-L-arabinose transferase-like glycosyltransferase